TMSVKTEELLPSAVDCQKRMVEAEAAKASEYVRKQAAVDAAKKALLDTLKWPSGVSDDDMLKRADAIIKRAGNHGLPAFEVGRLPNSLFTDYGRAINQQEAGWDETLTGLPKELFQFWKQHLQPKGYRIKCQIGDWPEGKPGDIGIS